MYFVPESRVVSSSKASVGIMVAPGWGKGSRHTPQDDEGKGARLPLTSSIGTHTTIMYRRNHRALERLGVGALCCTQELGVQARVLGKPKASPPSKSQRYQAEELRTLLIDHPGLCVLWNRACTELHLHNWVKYLKSWTMGIPRGLWKRSYDHGVSSDQIRPGKVYLPRTCQIKGLTLMALSHLSLGHGEEHWPSNQPKCGL